MNALLENALFEGIDNDTPLVEPLRAAGGYFEMNEIPPGRIVASWRYCDHTDVLEVRAPTKEKALFGLGILIIAQIPKLVTEQSLDCPEYMLVGPTYRPVVLHSYENPSGVRPAVLIHELGHMIVDVALGRGQGNGIEFSGRTEREGAVYGGTPSDVAYDRILCSLGGILAHVIFAPDTLAPHLLKAYEHSVIFSGDHPHLDLLTENEREFLSGADIDMANWQADAIQICGDGAGMIQLLREAEREVKKLFSENPESILRVVDDIHDWSLEDDCRIHGRKFYSNSRADTIVGPALRASFQR